MQEFGFSMVTGRMKKLRWTWRFFISKTLGLQTWLGEDLQWHAMYQTILSTP